MEVNCEARENEQEDHCRSQRKNIASRASQEMISFHRKKSEERREEKRKILQTKLIIHDDTEGFLSTRRPTLHTGSNKQDEEENYFINFFLSLHHYMRRKHKKILKGKFLFRSLLLSRED